MSETRPRESAGYRWTTWHWRADFSLLRRAATDGARSPRSGQMPASNSRVYDMLDAGSGWLADKLGPAVPPELRPKLRAIGEILHAISPATALQGYAEAMRQGHYGDAALNAFGLFPGETIAAGAAKLALPFFARLGPAPNFVV